MTTFVLTRPGTATAASNVNVNPEVLIPAGSTVNVDTCSCTHLSVKWIITLYNEIEPVTHTAEILAMHTYETSPRHTRYAQIGDKIKYDTNVIISGGSFILQIINNELYDITTTVVQITTTYTSS